MKIYSEKSLQDFNFWCEAADNAARLSGDELDAIEAELESLYDGEIDETDLNDIFRFDFEWVCSLIGLVYDRKAGEIIRE